MRASTIAAIAAPTVYVVAAIRHAQKIEAARAGRGHSPRPQPTADELRATYNAARERSRTEHRQTHRFTVAARPELIGTKCHTCGEVLPSSTA